MSAIGVGSPDGHRRFARRSHPPHSMASLRWMTSVPLHEHLKISAPFAAAILLAGCASVSPPNISFKDIGPADRNEIFYYSTDRKWIAEHPDVLRLRFTSSQVLTTVKYPVYSFGATISLCPYNEERFISGSSVLYNGRDLMDFRGNGAPDPRPDPEDGQYVYEIFFRYIEQVQLNPKTGRMDSYPLPDNPMDICFRLHGLREWFPIFSNVSTVPADLLAKALRELNTR